MITLGIDPGVATLGLALVDATGRVLRVGESLLPAAMFDGSDSDRLSARVTVQANTIGQWLKHADRVCSEKLSLGMPSVKGQLYNAIGWTIAASAAHGVGKPYVGIRPQTWQRMVLPGSGRKVDEEQLYATLRSYLERQSDRCIHTSKLHSHGLDALGLALCGALSWEALQVQKLGKPTKRKKRKTKVEKK